MKDVQHLVIGLGKEEGRQEGLGNVCQPHFPGQGKQRESRCIAAVFQGVRNVRRQEIFPRIDHESCRIGRQQGVDEALEFYMNSLKEVFMYSSPAEYVAAIVVEPLQGEGGFIPAPIPWIKALRKVCDDNGILLIADEVQTGWCRTGRMLAAEYWKEAGCPPDIIATAKSIGGGIPLGAVVAREKIMESVPAGVIGGTFGGNALACASALKVIEIMERDHLADRALEIGKKVCARYEQWKQKYDVIGDYRGLGAMLGLEFVHDKAGKEPYPELVTAVIKEAAQHGLIMENCGIYDNVIRFLCPLVVTDAQLDAGLDILEQAILTCTK